MWKDSIQFFGTVKHPSNNRRVCRRAFGVKTYGVYMVVICTIDVWMSITTVEANSFEDIGVSLPDAIPARAKGSCAR